MATNLQQQLIQINGQQQQQTLSPCTTMPAMPKEKATAVSLNENNFSELKLKELSSNATVTVNNTNTMATTATSRMHQHTTNTPTHHLPAAAQTTTAIQLGSTTTTHRTQRQQQQQHQPQQQQMSQPPQARNSFCGCGAASAIPEVVGSLNHGSSKYLTNGHSSPLAAAVAAAQQNGATSPQHTPSCCRHQQQQQQQQQQQPEHQQPQHPNGYNNGAEQQLLRTNNGLGGGAATHTTAINIASASTHLAARKHSTCAVAASASPINNVAVTPPKKSPNDYIFGKYIGEGSFSNVYLAVDVHTKREYAIKVCEKRHILREDKQEYVRREREAMHMMTNVPGFVNLSCTFQDRRSLYFVMTYAKNGDLLPYINKVGSFDVDCTRHYVAELVLACEQMHRRNVVHRDLKPENILLDEDMHTLIADFGSAKILKPEERNDAYATMNTATATTTSRLSRSSNNRSDEDEDEDADDTNDTGSDEDRTHSGRPGRYYNRRRKGSFVGTAQYVSPEVLQNGPITPAADLWALGCIVYQMISGLPPFRGSNDYVIFKEILACDLDFPQGFDKDAEDLVRKLLKVKPDERLGAHDIESRYVSIRTHPFFNGIDFGKVRQETPPPIYPYLPGVSKDEDFRSQYRMPENLEPGLDDRQLTRLLGMELGTSLGNDDDYKYNGREIEKKTVIKNIYDLSDAEKQKRLEQQKSDKWHAFADNEVILKLGYINKRKGLFARKRMLLLTTGPRLIYIDPVQMVKKGEIPWSAELRVEPKNFKIFFVHTPNRTYYLDDPDGYSLEWVDAIERMRQLTYPHSATGTAVAAATTTATGTSPKSSHRTNSPTHLTNGSSNSGGSSSSGKMLTAAIAAATGRTTKTASN